MFLVLVVLMSFFLVACNQNEGSFVGIISANGFEIDETNMYIEVPDSTTIYSFIDQIAVSSSATWELYSDITGENQIATKTIDLSFGDNTVYVLVKKDDKIKLYTCVVKRMPPEATINGNSNINLEVGSDYNDEGINFPETYTLVTSGEVDTNIIGTYEISYSIYTDEDELVKELTRVINVVDTTPPDLQLLNTFEYKFGVNSEKDLIVELEDNYYSESELIVSSNIAEINPDQDAGSFEITILVEDPSGNISSKKMIINFLEFNLYDFFENIFLEGHSLIESGYQNDLSSGEMYYWINLKDGNNIVLREDGGCTYYYTINTAYGEGEISLSADYGFFNSANVGIHIGSEIDNYTYAFVGNYDILTSTPRTNIEFSVYSLNYLNIPQNETEEILNNTITTAIRAFKDLFEELNLVIK
jgi:hypothetical protein